MWAAVALHPNEAPRLSAEGGEEALDEALTGIEELAALPQVLAVGETGLDYFRTGPEGVAAQQRSFRAHIGLAKRLDKALVIHDREAHADVLRLLEEEGAPERTVFHCFSGDAEMARLCAARGWYMSFAGNITFKNAQPLRDALAVVPPELLLVETDAPFLTPAPYRGRPPKRALPDPGDAPRHGADQGTGRGAAGPPRGREHRPRLRLLSPPPGAAAPPGDPAHPARP